MRRRLALPLLFGLGFLVLAGLGLALLQNRGGASGIASVGGPFRLTDGAGRSVTDADLRGRPFVVFFGYTHCPDICPTTLFQLSELARKMGPKAVPMLFVTVDPERDTPAVMQEYVSSFDPHIRGLSGDRATLDPVLKAYRVYAKKVPSQSGDYTMDHTALVYLMDKTGRFVASLDLDQPDAAAREIAAQS